MGREERHQCHRMHFRGWEERDGSNAIRCFPGDGKGWVVAVPLEPFTGMERKSSILTIRIHAFWSKIPHSSLGPRKMLKIKVLIIQNWSMKSSFSFQNTFSKYHLMFIVTFIVLILVCKPIPNC